MGTDEVQRQEFVKEMYRVYWTNIDRSMEGVWKVLAPITVAGTILAGIHKDYLPVSLGLALVLIVILWALNITIDLNAWHRRNLQFTSKAEQVFLSDEDYGRLLPEEYKEPKLKWITIYKINLITFVSILLFTIVYAWAWKPNNPKFVDGWLLPVCVMLVGLPLTMFNYWEQEQSAQRHFNELFKDDTQ